MSEALLVCRQPLLDTQQRVFAYEFMLRSEQQLQVPLPTPTALSTAWLGSLFGELGLQHILGGKPGLLSVDQLLLDDAIEALPAASLILEIDVAVLQDDELLQRCRQLQQLGYRLALTGLQQTPPADTSPLWSFCKLDISRIAPEQLPDLVAAYRGDARLIADRVDDRLAFKAGVEAGFDAFQGCFFMRPEPVGRHRVEADKIVLMRLIAMLLQDAETATLEAAMKHHPGLVFSLIRLVNCAASGMTRKVASLPQAIMALGRKQMERWLQLLLYANANRNARTNPLMQTAAIRGKLMELLVLRFDSTLADAAFMTGILSLMDTAVGMTMEDMVRELSITDQVADALLDRSGKLGWLLLICECVEHRDLVKMVGLLKQNTFIGIGDVTDVQLDAMAWANDLDREL